MSLHLYDTWSRTAREFQPLTPGEVGLYTCGPTVYDYQHIGNFRTFLFEDGLKRVLQLNGFNVNHVMNITDVGHLVSDGDEGEDKMEKGSRRTGKTAWDIAALYTEEFVKDLALLGIAMPVTLCKATDHIAEQIAFIVAIEGKGFAYTTSDGVYFDTSKQDDYGFLGRLDKKGLQSGARVDIGEKRSATDYALWKFSQPDDHRQMEWDSPWGRGFPGWHIECSAMAHKYLGAYFDIHCGGEDHITVHHPNEISQTEAAYGTRLANFWMHGHFLLTGDAKMSKSAGEFLRLQLLIDKGYDPMAYRFLCLTAHYRSQLNFSWDALDAASTALGRLRRAVYDSRPAAVTTQPDALGTVTSAEALLQPLHTRALPGSAQAPSEVPAQAPTQALVQAPPQGDVNVNVNAVVDVSRCAAFLARLNDDLNFPQALALAWETVKSDLPAAEKHATLLWFDQALGLGLADWVPAVQTVPPEVQALADARWAARSAKDWVQADVLRQALAEKGWAMKDGKADFSLSLLR